jgi:STE24 endopeptidase
MQTRNGFQPAASTQAYLAQIPPDVKQRASDYTHGNHWLLGFGAVVVILINLLVLRSGLLEKIGRRLERARSRPWVISLWVFASYFAAMRLLGLPWAAYTNWWREVHYGVSHQSGGAWLAESLVSAVFSCIVLGVLVMLLYAVIRRSPRKWWLWSSVVTSSVIFFVMVIAPVVLEPAFNDYVPLASGRNHDIVEALAADAGIPPGRVVSYDGSKQSNNYTAHVAGLFGTARIAISDALLDKASEAELRAVVGHEIGHFVLHHELWMTLLYIVLMTFVFWLTHHLYRPLACMLHEPHSARLADPAGLPVIAIIVTVAFLLLAPVTNGVTRFVESQADEYSLRHVQEPDGMATGLLRSANYRAADPGRVEEWLFYDHPSIARRIDATIAWKAGHPHHAPVP